MWGQAHKEEASSYSEREDEQRNSDFKAAHFLSMAEPPAPQAELLLYHHSAGAAGGTGSSSKLSRHQATCLCMFLSRETTTQRIWLTISIRWRKNRNSVWAFQASKLAWIPPMCMEAVVLHEEKSSGIEPHQSGFLSRLWANYKGFFSKTHPYKEACIKKKKKKEEETMLWAQPLHNSQTTAILKNIIVGRTWLQRQQH